MQLSVEISLYPLNEDYKTIIKDFLEELSNKHSSIETRSNNMSTRIFGDFDNVHTAIQETMRYSMNKFGKMVFVCKYLQGDARELSAYN